MDNNGTTDDLAIDRCLHKSDEDLEVEHIAGLKSQARYQMNRALCLIHDPAECHKEADAALVSLVEVIDDPVAKRILADYDLLKSRFWYE